MGAMSDGWSRPFRPAWWCPGPHAQTLWGALLRRTPRVEVRRERWDTPDGDFLDIDRLDGPPGSPLLLILHGLEGSSRSTPVLGLLAGARCLRWRAAAMNFRSCSGEPNRLPRSYHGGETGDLTWVVERLAGEEPETPLFCVGFSLGGNVLLKYLGERGDAAPRQVRAAAAISTPFDLAASARWLASGPGALYTRRLVASLRRKTLNKLQRYPGLVDRKAVLKVQTLEQFDNAVTAPVHGFANADAYWAASSSLQFLAGIRRPTLLINALDDPFYPGRLLPVREASANPNLRAVFPSHGGHMGFLSGFIPGLSRPWAEAQTLAFFKNLA